MDKPKFEIFTPRLMRLIAAGLALLYEHGNLNAEDRAELERFIKPELRKPQKEAA